MKRKIITTSDGSSTIFIKAWNEHYHSKHGALQEALHVFIKHGLDQVLQGNEEKIAILEMGFGSGLNALLTFDHIQDKNCDLHYVGVEGFPLDQDEINALNFADLPQIKDVSLFRKIHDAPWNAKVSITKNAVLEKRHEMFEDVNFTSKFDLIYFDAFGARVQPHLWAIDILRKMYKSLKNGGVFVTYSAKGSVRRDLIALGFEVTKLPGPPGKRHMLRAVKL